jgi:hypothetical protein
MVQKAIDEMLAVVATAADVSAGMRRLIDFTRVAAPPLNKLWDGAARQDFASDAWIIKAMIQSALSEEAPPADLDQFFVVSSSGHLQFGAMKKAGHDADQRRMWHGPQIESQVFARLQRKIPGASIGDYAICFGYVGLALRETFAQLPTALTLGDADQRTVVWGPHDGGLFRLGTIRPSGLELGVCEDHR